MYAGLRTVDGLVATALALGASEISGWSPAEDELVSRLDLTGSPDVDLHHLAEQIREGGDPLGDAFCSVFSPVDRRPNGATYTPKPIVEAMVAWAEDNGAPARIVDPGSASGRFLISAARTFADATLVGVELDPLAALLGRANLAATGLGDRSHLALQDYRDPLPEAVATDGPTLFLGNPPYVRHHVLHPTVKRWLVDAASELGLGASRLAGLHLYFFLATARHAKPGDYGVFVTSAEWLDVNYGKLVRELLLEQLASRGLHVIEPEAKPFEDAQTTAVIASFKVAKPTKTVILNRVADVSELGRLRKGKRIHRARLAEARRWTPLTRAASEIPEGYIELGELCRVHRGAVTGANDIWVTDPDSGLVPPSALYPSVTRARELFDVGHQLLDASTLRRVIDLPADLDEFDSDERRQVERFLQDAMRAGAKDTYIAKNRNPWWSVKLRDPAPVLATYMARRPPTFVRNLVGARHINIAHGLYPREELPDHALDALAEALRASVTQAQGRTYAGGLTKFEPKEMERLPVPDLPQLLQA